MKTAGKGSEGAGAMVADILIKEKFRYLVHLSYCAAVVKGAVCGS